MLKSRLGVSLAGALCVISVALLAALTIGTSASLNVGMLQQTENVQTASLLADSAIQQAIAELMKSPSWGSNPATDQIAYNGPVDRSSVRLTFNKNAGVPYGLNNQTGAPVDGWAGSRLLSSRKVPPQRVHLVAVARCRNVVRTREAVIYTPNFTTSLGATGKVHLHSSLVGSLKNAADLADLDSHPELLGPGDLATNCDLSDSAILEQGSRVTGNLQSRGDVSLQTGSSVEGEVRRAFTDAELPHFDFDEYDPAKPDPDNPGPGPMLYTDFSAGMHGDENLTGLVRCDGSATVNGDLKLDNCIFYVTGNLKVVGGIRGQGAVIVKGSTEVEGGATLASDDDVALLGRGDVKLLGSQSQPYTFQGLVYTRGNFTANYFTVVGGFVADGAVPGTGNVDMHGSRIFHAPSATHVDIFVPYQFSLQFASIINESPKNVPLSDQNKYFYGQHPVADGGQLNADNPVNYDTPLEAANYSNPGGGWDWWNPAFLQISRQNNQYVYDLIYTDGGAKQQLHFNNRNDLINTIDSLHASKCPAYHDGLDANGDPYPPDDATVQIKNFGSYTGPDPGFLNLKVGDPNPLAGLHKETSPYLRKAWDLKLDIWEQRNKINSTTNGAANFSFDPNRFLKEHDKIRLSAVTEY